MKKTFLDQKYDEYLARFQKESDEKLIANLEREKKVKGWVGVRGSYLLALKDEMKRRGLLNEE